MDPENETRINGSDGGEEGDGGMEESMAIPPPPPPPIPAEEGGGEVTGHDGSKSVNRIEFDLTAQLQVMSLRYLDAVGDWKVYGSLRAHCDVRLPLCFFLAGFHLFGVMVVLSFVLL